MITIREANPEDRDPIAHWQVAMAEETEGRSLPRDVVTAGVAAALADPSKGFYLIAERDQVPVASLFVTREWSDWRNGWFWWIQSVYVEPNSRGIGVYRAMHAAVTARAMEAMDRVVGIRLYVEQDNARARSTYEARGMHATAYRLYEQGLLS
ncbi:MAG: GNAT family N-acetyltransferase [Planctomycetes bacterium]|nr:GNAT family N-acetyltransferase [Planctomycetota bacterium]